MNEPNEGCAPPSAGRLMETFTCGRKSHLSSFQRVVIKLLVKCRYDFFFFTNSLVPFLKGETSYKIYPKPKYIFYDYYTCVASKIIVAFSVKLEKI
jgi:hypothetical protein